MDKAFNRKSVIFMFLGPALVFYTLIVIVSILWAMYYSVFDWNGMGQMKLVGLDNYIELLFNDKNFWPVLNNTIIYTLWQILHQVGGGLLIAILLTRIFKFRAGLQTFYYVPVVISTVAISQIFDKFFSVTPVGLINSLLSMINGNWIRLEWLSNPNTSLYIAAFVEGYKYAGMYAVILYAALISVPEELSEAAIIDGASMFRQYLNVKIPYIWPVIVTNCVLVLNGSLRSFDIPFLLTKGGPGNSSELLAPYMYKQAFSSMKYGYGSTVAVSIVVLCVILGGLFRRLTEREDVL